MKKNKVKKNFFGCGSKFATFFFLKYCVLIVIY